MRPKVNKKILKNYKEIGVIEANEKEAKELIKKGLTTETIEKYTLLTKEEIDKLRK